MLDAFVSMKHLLIHFLFRSGIGELCSDQQFAKQCFQMAPKLQDMGRVSNMEHLDHREPEKSGELTEQLLSFPLGSDLLKLVQVEALLSKKERNWLLDFLQANSNIFTWSVSDMLGIPLEVITHKLSIDPKYKPIKQKKKALHQRGRAVDETVDATSKRAIVEEEKEKLCT